LTDPPASGTPICHTLRPSWRRAACDVARCNTSECTTNPWQAVAERVPCNAIVGTDPNSRIRSNVKRTGMSGSITRSLTGRFGRLPLKSIQVAPAFTVLKMWPKRVGADRETGERGVGDLWDRWDRRRCASPRETADRFRYSPTMRLWDRKRFRVTRTRPLDVPA